MFAICNAGAYLERQIYFYPLKNKLLKKYGIADGYDLQKIERQCWQCEGTGIDEWHDSEQCTFCEGTGIYKTVEIVLARCKLGKKVYHLPTDILSVQVAPKNIIRGLVCHKRPTRKEFLKALKILLLVYDFPSFYSLMYNIYQEKKRGRKSILASFFSS